MSLIDLGGPLVATPSQLAVEAMLAGEESPAELLEYVRAQNSAGRLWARRGLRPQRLLIAVCPEAPGRLAALTEPIATLGFNIEGAYAEAIAGYFVLLAQCAQMDPDGSSWSDLERSFATATTSQQGHGEVLELGPVADLWPRPDSIRVRCQVRIQRAGPWVSWFTGAVWSRRYALETFSAIVDEVGSGRIDAHIAVHRGASNIDPDVAVADLRDAICESAAQHAATGSGSPDVECVRVDEVEGPTWHVPRVPKDGSRSYVVAGLAQPGFVHQAMDEIESSGGMIAGAAMGVLEGRTVLHVIVEGSDDKDQDLATALNDRFQTNDDWKNLPVNLGRPWGGQAQTMQLGPAEAVDERADCVVSGRIPDEPGVIHNVALAIANTGTNIVRLRTELSIDDVGSELRIHASLAASTSLAFESLRTAVSTLEAKMRWTSGKLEVRVARGVALDTET